jgi:hypothetical protein
LGYLLLTTSKFAVAIYINRSGFLLFPDFQVDPFSDGFSS